MIEYNKENIENIKNSANIPIRNGKPCLSAANSSVLAYIGDAVYELYARKAVFEKGIVKPDLLNRETIKYVRAESQALAFDGLLRELSEIEAGVVRRAKNHKITSMPHNVDTLTYKKATGFEALIGYLFLENETERLEKIIYEAFKLIEADPVINSGFSRG